MMKEKFSDLGCCTGFLGECIKCCPPSADADAVAMTDDEVADAQQSDGASDSEGDDTLPDWAVAMLIALPILSCAMGGGLVYFTLSPGDNKGDASLLMNQPTN